MRVRIQKPCIDAKTKKSYIAGELIELPDDRADKAIARGLAVSDEPEKAEKPVRTRKKTTTKK